MPKNIRKSRPSARSAYHLSIERSRELLASEATGALPADLPSLTVKELVALWDVLWLIEEQKEAGLAPFGESFARTSSRG